MEAHPYYIDQECKIIEFEDIASHIGIAKRIVEDDELLKKEFENSKMQYQTDFLIERKGFIQVTDEVGNGWYNKKLLFSASKMKPAQKRMIMGLIDEGFTYENVDNNSKNNVRHFHDFDV